MIIRDPEQPQYIAYLKGVAGERLALVCHNLRIDGHAKAEVADVVGAVNVGVIGRSIGEAVLGERAAELNVVLLVPHVLYDR